MVKCTGTKRSTFMPVFMSNIKKLMEEKKVTVEGKVTIEAKSNEEEQTTESK